MRISDWSSDVCSSDLLLFSLSSCPPSIALASSNHGGGDFAGRGRSAGYIVIEPHIALIGSFRHIVREGDLSAKRQVSQRNCSGLSTSLCRRECGVVIDLKRNLQPGEGVERIPADRSSVVEGRRGSVRVINGGGSK